MSQELIIAVAAQLAQQWADAGGGVAEYAVACRRGELVAIVDLPATPELDDAGRRAALGALTRATECDTFADLTDSNVTIDGAPTEALLCLELAIVDLPGRVAGAAVHIAPYRRKKRRFGADTIDMGAFQRRESAEFGSFAGELMAIWHLEGDQGRLGALDVLTQVGATLSDVHPAMSAEFAELLDRQDG